MTVHMKLSYYGEEWSEVTVTEDIPEIICCYSVLIRYVKDCMLTETVRGKKL